VRADPSDLLRDCETVRETSRRARRRGR